MTCLLGLLASAYQVVLPDPLHYRSLQMKQTRSLEETKPYETQITQTLEYQEE